MFISLTDANGTYSIRTDKDYDTLGDIVDMLIKPVLRAATFSEESISKFFKTEEEVDQEQWDQLEINFFAEEEVVEKKVAVKA
jgi:hypothetical protein